MHNCTWFIGFLNSPPDVAIVALVDSAAVRHQLWSRDDHHPKNFYNSPLDVSIVALVGSAAVRHQLWSRDDHHPTVFLQFATYLMLLWFAALLYAIIFGHVTTIIQQLFTIRRLSNVALVCSAAVRHHLWSRDDHRPTIFLQFAARCLYCCSPFAALLYATIFGHVTAIIRQFFYNSLPDVSIVCSAAVRHHLWSRDDHHPTDDQCHSQVPRHAQQCPRVHETSRGTIVIRTYDKRSRVAYTCKSFLFMFLFSRL
jgi:hypothetical protein